MSQINDALKRAQDIQAKTTPSSVSPMLPVASTDAPPGANWLWPVVILLLLLLFAGLFIAIAPGLLADKQTVAESAPAPAVELAPAAAPTPAPVTPAALAPAVPAPKPARIQGIVYDPVHPYAIISGKTVFVGDAVDGMRVTAISPEVITLAGNGQTNQLRVGGH